MDNLEIRNIQSLLDCPQLKAEDLFFLNNLSLRVSQRLTDAEITCISLIRAKACKPETINA